jgi:fluoroacetyl-CoA thioesterase
VKDSLKSGLQITQRITVDTGRTIGFMGDEFRVYSTPSMVLDIERTCKGLLDKHLDEGENSVGARVEIDHLGATLLDMWVDVRTTITEIDGRRVLFNAEVHDQLGDKVGACQHTRFIVDLSKQKIRLDAKRSRLSSG